MQQLFFNFGFSADEVNETLSAGVKSEIGIQNFPKAILICFIKCVGEGGLKLISTIKILKSLPPDASANFSLIPNQILILIVIQLQILQQPTNSPQQSQIYLGTTIFIACGIILISTGNPSGSSSPS